MHNILYLCTSLTSNIPVHRAFENLGKGQGVQGDVSQAVFKSNRPKNSSSSQSFMLSLMRGSRLSFFLVWSSTRGRQRPRGPRTELTKRKYTFKYHVQQGGQRLAVCLIAFILQ